MRKLEHLSPRDREAIEHFSRALMNKFLHEPSVRLRAAAANGRGLGVVDALRYLFDLDAPRTLRAPDDARRHLLERGALNAATRARHRRGRIHRLARGRYSSSRTAMTSTVLDNLSSGQALGTSRRRDVPRSSTSARPRRRRSCATGSFDVICHLAAQIDVRKSVADPAVRREHQHRRLAQPARGGARSRDTPRAFIFSSHGRRGVRRSRRRRRTSEDAPKDPRVAVRHREAQRRALHGVLRARARPRQRGAALRERLRAASGSARRGRRGRDLLRPHSSTARRSRCSAMADRRATTCSWATWRGRISPPQRVTLPAAAVLDSRAFNIGTAIETSMWCSSRTLLQGGVRRLDRRSCTRRRAPASSAARPSHRQGSAKVLGWKPKMSLAMDFARHVRNGSRRAARERNRHDARSTACRSGGAVPTSAMDMIRQASLVTRSCSCSCRALARELGDHARRSGSSSTASRSAAASSSMSSSARRRSMRRRGLDEARQVATRSRACSRAPCNFFAEMKPGGVARGVGGAAQRIAGGGAAARARRRRARRSAISCPRSFRGSRRSDRSAR